MRLGQLRAGQKQFGCLPVLLPPIRSHGAFLAELHGKAGDPSDNVVGGIKQLPGFIVLSLRGLKPAADALELASVVLCDDRGIHGLHPGNGRLVSIDLLQHRITKRRTEILQQFLDDADISLKCRDKIPEILHQLVLKQQELPGMHHFLCPNTAQIPDIVVIILVESGKIPFQLVPEIVGLCRRSVSHIRKALQRPADSLQ